MNKNRPNLVNDNPNSLQMVVVYDTEHGCTCLCLKPIYKIDFAHFNKQFFLL